MKKEGKKKKFYKKWWFWLIIIVIFISAVAGGGNDNKKDDSTQVASENADSDNKAKEEVKQEEKKDDSKIKSGTYKVGTDIPAGEYIVISKSLGYIESASDSTGALESIVFNDNLSKGSNSYVTLNDGEYFKMTGAEAYPVASAPSVIPEDGLYKDGMYKVGIDIPAGEYKIMLDNASGLGYYEVATDSSHQLTSIVTNENVQADTYLTIQEGQYLKLSGVKIQK
ncbi:hypothetical protein [Clostridium sp.]|uniref:hypothetical protein n=1 Tax=Clostridium sp. TaxID=1506 RepID=UPI002902FA35|nr:hypothetical protein [Clostridium sp.]MDU2155768.1 hypothetical protein [Clostridium sp.]